MTSNPHKKRRMKFLHRPVETYSKFWLGVAAIGVLVVALVATLTINSLDLDENSYKANFAQAAQIGKGDQVTVAGIPVGTVTGTELAGDHVVVSMKIKKDTPMGKDTRASIKLTTLLGSRYVELKPAGNGTLPDSTIPIANTTVPYNLQDALANATTTFGDMDADKIAKSMTDMSNQLEGTPELLPQALTNIKNLSTVIADRRSDIGALLQSTAKVTDVVRNQQSNLGALMNQGRDVLQEVMVRRNAIENLLASTTTLVHKLEPILVDDQPEIQQLIDNLNTMVASLSKNDALLRNILQVLPIPWRNFSNGIATGPEFDAGSTDLLPNTWMCALSGRSEQLKLQPYFKDCK